jgi:hypothetical protein
MSSAISRSDPTHRFFLGVRDELWVIFIAEEGDNLA